MKRNLKLIIGASAASVLTFSALAQEAGQARELDRRELLESRQGDSQQEARRQGESRQAARRADRLNGAIRSGDLIGMTVKNYRNDTLGKVEDVAVDVESGRIVQVILSTGGFIGIGDRLTAVPPGALHHDVALGILHLDADKEKLKASPEFDMAKWAECCESDRLSKVYRHYGEGDAYGFVQTGNATETTGQRPNRDGDSGTETPAQRRNREGTSGTETPAQRQNREGTSGTGNLTAQRNPEGTWDRDRTSHDKQSMIPSSRLMHVQKVSKIVGTPVKNLQDESLGKVESVLVDLGSGRMVAVVVSSGGFLGIGDELSAVPPAALRFNAGRDALQLDTTKEALVAAPHFKANEWPDFALPSYTDSVYRAHRVEPYFTTNTLSEADNTARNVRDRGNRTLTPLDQGNSRADVDITARIRRGIQDGKDMSVNARNVKVITNRGQVTLRGPVNTSEEKRLIGNIANGIALVANVDNQLEVQ